MEVFWFRGEALTSQQVIDELVEGTRWHPKTIRTLMNRLAKKGALEHRREGRAYWYRARVEREDCIRSESRNFLERVFGGEPDAMLIHLVENTPLTPAQIRRLKGILNRKEK